MAWTGPADVLGSWIGGDAPTDEVLVGTWIGKAERLIRYRVPTITARLAADEPDLLYTVKDVVAAMVQRVFRNPEGIRQVQESTGPFSKSATYGGDQPGELYLTGEELARLAGSVSPGQRAFTIDTTPATSILSPFYVPPLGGW